MSHVIMPLNSIETQLNENAQRCGRPRPQLSKRQSEGDQSRRLRFEANERSTGHTCRPLVALRIAASVTAVELSSLSFNQTRALLVRWPTTRLACLYLAPPSLRPLSTCAAAEDTITGETLCARSPGTGYPRAGPGSGCSGRVLVVLSSSAGRMTLFMLSWPPAPTILY